MRKRASVVWECVEAYKSGKEERRGGGQPPGAVAGNGNHRARAMHAQLWLTRTTSAKVNAYH